MQNHRSRGWCFTINNDTFKDLVSVVDLQARYIVFGFEIGEENHTPHIQGYCYFDNAKQRSALSKELPRASIRLAVGSPQQNLDYCSKQGDFYEFGDIPTQGKLGKEKIEAIMQDPYANFHLYNLYRRSYKELKEVEKQESVKDKPKRVFLIHEDLLRSKLDEYPDYEHIDAQDYDCWRGEEIMILYVIGSFPLEKWYKGFLPRIKKGYEVLKVDPTIVILCYNDDAQKSFFIKEYVDIIDYE